ncbi:MAG: fibronectin type III domain-containing protein, partial [Bacteroides sp.]|uniref:fibronectin type III domain-containing protein n=1 Tax=Bacteroides sp. TaxID=29523 RepID=UPI002FC3DEDB
AAPLEPEATGTWSGCLNSQVTFDLYQWDSDLNEDLEFRIDWGDGDGYGAWEGYAGTNTYNEDGYTKAEALMFHTFDSEATGTFRLQGRDQDGATSVEWTHDINYYNHEPSLDYPNVEPYTGDQDTYFDFYVDYSDCDGDSPTTSKVYYQHPGESWTYTTMSKDSGSTYSGTAGYTPSEDGTGNYYFEFSDGNGHTVTKGSETNPYNYEVSTNSAPSLPTDITWSVVSDPDRGYFYRNESVEFNATSTDPDNDDIRYGWDWDNDGSVDDWSSYYSSGSQCTITHTYPYSEPSDINFIKVKAEDVNGAQSSFASKNINLEDHAPVSSPVGGPSEVTNATTDTWNITGTDTEGDQLKANFDWGDGSTSDTVGWNASGSNMSASHTYTSKGEHTITVTLWDDWGDNTTDTVYHTVNVLGPPNPPQDFTVTPSNEVLHIEWYRNTTGTQPNKYGIKYWNMSKGESTANFIYEIPWQNSSNNENYGHNITNLDNDQQYGIRMNANNSYGSGEYSITFTGTPGHTPPTAPDWNVGLGDYSSQTVTLDWVSSIFYDGAVLDKYHILRSTDNINYVEVGNTTQTMYSDSGLTNGEKYYYKIYATDNKSADSGYSDVESTTVDSVNPTEAILESLPSNTYSLSVHLNWSESTDDVSGISNYIVQESTTNTFDTVDTQVTPQTTEYTFSENHQYSVTYYYRVRAVDGAGNKGEWNGPVQTKLETNLTTGTEYSKVQEIWFNKNIISINQQVLVTISVEDKYSIPSGYVSYSYSDSKTTMRLSSIGKNSYRYSAVWTPTSSGSNTLQLKVTNSNNAVNTIDVPVNVKTTNQTDSKQSVTVFEREEDTYVATFSETQLNVTSYKGQLGEYHVTFGEQPDNNLLLDLTNLEASYEQGYLGFIKLSWLDTNSLTCIMHGNKKITKYKVEAGGTIPGYNDFTSKYFGWLIGKDYTLVERDSNNLILSSIENSIKVKYDT